MNHGMSHYTFVFGNFIMNKALIIENDILVELDLSIGESLIRSVSITMNSAGNRGIWTWLSGTGD